MSFILIRYRRNFLSLKGIKFHERNTCASMQCFREVACAADETNLRLSPSAKQRRYSFSEPPPVYRDLSTRHDWPVKKAIFDLPIKMKGNSKRTSGNSLSPLGS